MMDPGQIRYVANNPLLKLLRLPNSYQLPLRTAVDQAVSITVVRVQQANEEAGVLTSGVPGVVAVPTVATVESKPILAQVVQRAALVAARGISEAADIQRYIADMTAKGGSRAQLETLLKGRANAIILQSATAAVALPGTSDGELVAGLRAKTEAFAASMGGSDLPVGMLLLGVGLLYMAGWIRL